jgi:hypothetical protein
VDSRQELLFLIDVMAQVISVVKVSTVDDPLEQQRKTDAHNLANRFLQFAMTVLHLSDDRNNVNLPSFGNIKLRDPASMAVLTRASMEAFLVFHQVFYSPAPRDEKEFRYWIYKAAGLVEGQGLPVGKPEHEEMKTEERKLIETIIDNLKSNTIFKKLTPKQREGIARGHARNLWRWSAEANKTLSWPEIATDAGLSPMLARYVYGHLSGDAHSGSRSVFQTQKAVVVGEVHKLVDPSLDTMKVLCANMVTEYTAIFKEAHDRLGLTDAAKFLEAWVQIGRRLGENPQALQ